MASGQNTFVPLPFFASDPGSKEEDEKNGFSFGSGNQFGHNAPGATYQMPPSTAPPQPTVAGDDVKAPSLPTDFFSSTISGSVPFFPLPETSGLDANVLNETPKEAQSSFSFGGEPFSFPAAPAQEQAPWNKPGEPSTAPVATSSAAVVDAPMPVSPQKPVPAMPWEAPQPSFTMPSQPPSSQPSFMAQPPPSKMPWEAPVVPAGDDHPAPWSAPSVAVNPATPGTVSWAAPPTPSGQRRLSQDSQPSSSLPVPSGLDPLTETLSVRSFTNLSLDGQGKACERCGKMNESLANFCCRCGAQVASPVESPADSQVFSVDSSALLPEQMQRLSLTESKPWTAAPVTELNGHGQFVPQPQFADQGHGQGPFATFTAAAPLAVASAVVSSPISPLPSSTGDRKPHPVFCFGLGGGFVMTFPSLQTRYNPTGQPISSYRPGMVYCGPLPSLPEARARLTESLTAVHEGAPLLELASRPKELSALLQRLRQTASTDEALLYGLFDLLLQFNGRVPLDNPKALEQLRSLLAPFNGANEISVPQQSPASLSSLSDAVLSGNLEGALQTALETGLWSHAMVLGHALGAPQLHRAVSAFVGAELPPCHPLRLAYLQLSGQSSSISKRKLSYLLLIFVVDELRANPSESCQNWASILLGLLGNRRSGPEFTAVLMALGEALAAQGESTAIASQFCFLLAQDETVWASGRLRLLSSAQSLIPLLRTTELYEAVRHASQPGLSLPHLFPLKLAHVSMLMEVGLVSLALRHANALGSLLRKSSWKDARFLAAYDALINQIEVYAEGNPNVQTVPAASESGGWFPKIGGLSDVLDRVIGSSEESGSSNNASGPSGLGSPRGRGSSSLAKSPILAQVNVMAESPVPSISHQAPVGGFDPFGAATRRTSVEPHFQPPKFEPQPFQPQSQSFQPQQFEPQSQPFQPQQPQAFQPQQFEPQSHAQTFQPEAQTFQPQSFNSPPSTFQLEPFSNPPTSQQFGPETGPSFAAAPWAPPQATEPTHQFGFPHQQPPAQQFGDQFQPPAQQQSSATQFQPIPFNAPQHPQEPAPMLAVGSSSPQFTPPHPLQTWQQPPMASFQPGEMNPGDGRLPPMKDSTEAYMQRFEAPSQVSQPAWSPEPAAQAQADDFSIGNGGLRKTESKPEVSSAAAVGDSGNDSEAKESETASRGSLLGGLLGGLFRRKQNASSPALSAGSGASSGPVKANLGESEMKLVYDEVKKQWVRKDTGAPPVAQAAAPPPPSMNSQSMSDTASPMSYRRGQAGGARGRYVDAFGSEATVAASAPANIPLPTPAFSNLAAPSEPQGSPLMTQPPVEPAPTAPATSPQQQQSQPWSQQRSPQLQPQQSWSQQSQQQPWNAQQYQQPPMQYQPDTQAYQPPPPSQPQPWQQSQSQPWNAQAQSQEHTNQSFQQPPFGQFQYNQPAQPYYTQQ